VRLAVAVIHPPNQALVEERTQRVENVDLVQAPDPVRHIFHRVERCAREHRQQLEKPLLARVELFVTPVDRVAQRLLPDRHVACSAP
jgi:hypothetical protein